MPSPPLFSMAVVAEHDATVNINRKYLYRLLNCYGVLMWILENEQENNIYRQVGLYSIVCSPPVKLVMFIKFYQVR